MRSISRRFSSSASARAARSPRDPATRLGEVVAHTLELAEREQARAAAAAHRPVDAGARVGGDEGLGELALELGDLVAQRAARRRARRPRRRSRPARSGRGRDRLFEKLHVTSCAGRESSTGPRGTTGRDRLRASLGAITVGERGHAGVQRLLDVDLGHALHLHREQRHPRRARRDAVAGGELAEQHRQRRALVGDDEPARRQPGARGVAARALVLGRAGPGAPSTRSASSAQIGTPVSTSAIEQRVVEQVARLEGALDQALQRRGLDGRAVGVGSRPMWR